MAAFSIMYGAIESAGWVGLYVGNIYPHDTVKKDGDSIRGRSGRLMALSPGEKPRFEGKRVSP